MPKFSKENTEIQELAFYTLMVMKYKDKRDVHLLSTVGDEKMADTGKVHNERNEPVKKTRHSN